MGRLYYVHESLYIVIDSSASYNSDVYDHFLPTVLFLMVKYENQIVKPSSQDFESFEFIS